MKLKSILFAMIFASLLSSCATTNLKNLDERKAVEAKAKTVISEVSGVKSTYSVYTKESLLRIFIEPENKPLSQETIDSVKAKAISELGISEDKITIFEILPNGKSEEK